MIDSYCIQFKPLSYSGGLAGWRTLNNNIKFLEIDITDLPCSTFFIFKIRSYNAKGWSDWSLPSKAIETLPLPPSRPGPPFATSVGSDYLVISWHRPENTNGAEVSSYSLDAKKEGSSTFVNCYTGHTPSYVATRLLSETVYLFRVCATNEAGTSRFSMVVALKTSKREGEGIRATHQAIDAPLREIGNKKL